MTEQELLNDLENFYMTLANLAGEIESHQLKNETKQAEVKIRKLEQLILENLQPTEQQHSTFGNAIAYSAKAVDGYILKIMIDRMGKIKIFDEIDEAVKNTAYTLTKEPHNLKRKVTINVVKFGFNIAVFEKLNKRGYDTIMTNLLMVYLKQHCQLGREKADEIMSATKHLASGLVNTFGPSMAGLLYPIKISLELYNLLGLVPGEIVFDLDETFKRHESSFGPLIKHIQLIYDLKLRQEVSQLESALKDFNKCIVQDYGASAEEVRDMGWALKIHPNTFVVNLLFFMTDKAGSVIAGTSDNQ